MTTARNLRPEPCRHAHQDRGACTSCGRVFSEGRPATRLPALTPREQRRQDALDHAQDMADARAVVLGAVDVAGIYRALLEQEHAQRVEAEEEVARLRGAVTFLEGLALRLLERARLAEGAAERAMEQLVLVGHRARTESMDVAAAALEAWLHGIWGAQ